MGYGLEWNIHVCNWMFTSKRRNASYTSYEGLLKDPFYEVKKILSNLGIKKYSDKEILMAIERASFDSMQIIEIEQGLGELYKDSNEFIKFVREGKSGNWLEYLPQEIIDKTIDKNEKLLKKIYEV
jgi:DNA-directed RNA polymerase subunit N (RpoN/RPB10)